MDYLLNVLLHYDMAKKESLKVKPQKFTEHFTQGYNHYLTNNRI